MQKSNKVVVIEDYKARVFHFYINTSEEEAQERFLSQGGYMPRQDFSETMNVFEFMDAFSIDSNGQVSIPESRSATLINERQQPYTL